jgi:membrane protein
MSRTRSNPDGDREPRRAVRPGGLRQIVQAAAGGKPDPDPTREGRLVRLVRYVRRLVDAYATHQCGLMASACAFSAIFSLIPLLAVAVAVAGFAIGGSDRALADAIAAIQAYVPLKAGTIEPVVSHVLADRRLIGIFGLLGLIYTAHQMFMSMEPAMNIIWNVAESRAWWRQRLVALAATLYTLVLLGADMAATVALIYLMNHPGRVLSNPVATRALHFGLAGLPIVLTTALFAQLYRILPARTVPVKPAYTGAFAAALLWQLMKFAFTLSLGISNGYARLYGSISSLAILFVWIYYSMSLLLLGAEIAADRESASHGADAALERAHAAADLTAARGGTALHRGGSARNKPGGNRRRKQENRADGN